MKKKGKEGRTDGLELPMGLGRALLQRPEAMARFAGRLPKKGIIDGGEARGYNKDMPSSCPGGGKTLLLSKGEPSQKGRTEK